MQKVALLFGSMRCNTLPDEAGRMRVSCGRRLARGVALLMTGAGCALTALAQSTPRAGTVQELQVQLWAASCMACHGPQGRAEGTGLTIGGRDANELLGRLLAYKQGLRPSTIMSQHAKGYSDDELASIAAYFSSLK